MINPTNPIIPDNDTPIPTIIADEIIICILSFLTLTPSLYASFSPSCIMSKFLEKLIFQNIILKIIIKGVLYSKRGFII